MNTDNCAVVCFADGKYAGGAQRLHDSLRTHGFSGLIKIFTDFHQLGCKPHSQVPYQFKTFAIKAIDWEQYPMILYLDASIFANSDVTPCFEHIEKHGHLLQRSGFSVGQWTADHCLDNFKITRDQAMHIDMHSAGFTGLDFRNPKTEDFFNHWHNIALDEHCFKGDWTNENQQCSQDPRCHGHRHDQSVASILAHLHGLDRIDDIFMKYLFNGYVVDPEVCFYAQGLV